MILLPFCRFHACGKSFFVMYRLYFLSASEIIDMPRIPKLQKFFVKPNNQWSPFPKRPLPFRMVEWETKKYDKYAIVTKIKPPSQIKKITPYKEWPIIKGDLVEIMVGKDKGKQGKIRAVARKKNQVKVIGMNLAENFVDDMGDGKPGYMLVEEPIHYSDIRLVDPFTGKATDVVLRYDENGKKVRVCVASGHIIPRPPFERTDWKSRSAVKEGEFDTKTEAVEKYTYVPSLLLFHEEIMKEMNVLATIPKTNLERRDLIFQEIESEAYAERKDAYLARPSHDDTFSGQIKRLGKHILFWKN